MAFFFVLAYRKIMIKPLILIFLLFGFPCFSEESFGVPGGEEVKKVDEVFKILREEPYDLEILMSFGTSSKGSAGHLALCVREDNDERVYSANFYADRAQEHNDHYNAKLVPDIDKQEYIYSQTSTLSDKAVFGLDYGEIFKRSLVGIRMSGIGSAKKKGIKNFYKRLNEDYTNQVSGTDYHYGEVVYDYMNLNCAKSVAQALKFGAGYEAIELKGNHLLSRLPGSQYIFSHTPTATAMNIMAVLAKSGVKFSVVLYKKFLGSEFFDQELEMKFKDLPNRFPSFKSLDFFNGSNQYESYENLKAMHLLYHMGRHSLIIDESTRELRIEHSVKPKSYEDALRLAKKEGYSKSKNLLRRVFRSMGVKITSGNDNSDLYDNPPAPEMKLFPFEPQDK